MTLYEQLMPEIHEGMRALKKCRRTKELLAERDTNVSIFKDSHGKIAAAGHGLWKIEGSAAIIGTTLEGSEFNDLVNEGYKKLVLVIKGRLTIKKGDEDYYLTDGDHISIGQGEVYSITCKERSCVLVATFPAEDAYPEGLEVLNQLLNSHGP